MPPLPVWLCVSDVCTCVSNAVVTFHYGCMLGKHCPSVPTAASFISLPPFLFSLHCSPEFSLLHIHPQMNESVCGHVPRAMCLDVTSALVSSYLFSHTDSVPVLFVENHIFMVWSAVITAVQTHKYSWACRVCRLSKFILFRLWLKHLSPLSLSLCLDSFSKLEDIHTNFMDEKDRVITEIYNTSKERARWVLNVFSLMAHLTSTNKFSNECAGESESVVVCAVSQGQRFQETDRNPAAQTRRVPGEV